MRRRSLPILAASLGAVLATAGAASAADFCVDRGGCDAGRTFTGDLQAALNAAAAFSGADRVLIGPGTYARTGAAGFTYDATSPVEIAGNPGEATIIATGPGLGADGAALTVVNGPHVVRDLDVFVGTADRRGVRFAGSVMRDVLVTNEVGIAAQGVVMGGSATLDHVQVVQEGAAGADAVLAPCACTIRDSGISTDGTGIRLSGSQAVVERTRIRAAVGLSADSGGAAVRDSVIRPVGDDGVGARARNTGAGTDAIRISLSRVTIAGDGAAGQTGVSAAADDGTETASVTVEGGIIAGVAVPVRREAAGGRSANVTLRWTNVPATGNVDQNTSGGTGAIDASDHVTTHPATFVNPVQGDFTPQAGSPLIDAGDPAQALTGVTDLVGTVRALDGDGDGRAVVDLGAVEAPAVAVTTPTVTTPEDPGTGTTTTPTVTSSAPVDLTPPRLRGGLLLKPTLRLRVSVAEAATVTIRLQRLAGTRWVNTGAVIRRTTTRRTLLTVPLTVPRIRARYRVVVSAADRSGNTFLLRGARVRLGVR
ncbi:MAG: hypothetical protein IT200_07110 [Thermoleophilia bacterium]|nr:hypothetical protein [Thermoleophilia bacterium]